jgi:hypothetical protein
MFIPITVALYQGINNNKKIQQQQLPQQQSSLSPGSTANNFKYQFNR